MATPAELRFNYPTHSQGIVGDKTTVRILPESGSGQSFLANDTVSFKLKGLRAIDPRSIRLCYTISIEDSYPTHPFFDSTSGQWGGNYLVDPNAVAPGVAQDIDNYIAAKSSASGMYTTFHSGDRKTRGSIDGRLTRTMFGGGDDMLDGGPDKAGLGPEVTVAHLLGGQYKCSWMNDHGSGIIRTLTVLLNGTTQIERIDRYNRARGFLAENTIDEHWKSSWGQHEGYQPRIGTLSATSEYLFNGSGHDSYTTGRIQNSDSTDPDTLSKMHPQNAFKDKLDRATAWQHGLSTCSKLWIPSSTVTPPQALGFNQGPTDSGVLTGFGGVVQGTKWWDCSKASSDDQKVYMDGKRVDANNKFSARKRQVSVPLDLSGFLSQNKLISLAAIGSLDLQILLDDNNVCINNIVKHMKNTDSTFNDDSRGNHRDYLRYVIEDVYLTVNQFALSPNYNAALAGALQGPGLIFDHPTYEVFAPPIRDQNAQILLRRNLRNLKTIWVFFADKALINGAGASDTSPELDRINKTTNFPSFNLRNYNILIDGRPATSNVISTKYGESAEAIHELAKSFRINGDNLMGTRFNTESYHRDCFGIGLDFEKTSLMSGTRMQDLQIDLEFGTHSSFDGNKTDLTAFVVFHYDQRVVVREMGQTQIIF